MRKKHGYGFGSPKNKKKVKKKMTNEELMAKLEADLQLEKKVRGALCSPLDLHS